MRYKILLIILGNSLQFIHFNNVTAQSVCIDSVLIDGSIRKYMNYSDFIRTGVKIDSIIKPNPMQYADVPDSVIYVGSSMFFVDKRKRCDAVTVWFDKLISVKLGKYVINNATTFNDLKRMFPTDCASTRPIKHYSFKGIVLETCSLHVHDSKGQTWDMRITFFLRDNKLIGLDFWEPI